MRTQTLVSAALLALLWIGLPVRLPAPVAGPANEQCLALDDVAPDPRRSDLIPEFEQCSARRPTDVALMAQLGALYEGAGRVQNAEATYRRALTIDPAYADLRIRIARLAMSRGDGSTARREAEAALEVQPNRGAVLELRQEAARVSPGAK